uniref:Uncharacterized protein n=1 Tax=Candidatus Kentrum sp. UNK TaxID=2126344 RepID=A0A451AI71_9GAMM|nr:MAG: hypothetical protein BECKUNK1418G_GA0071005_106819 [Candidatus Kentron sp. UNK]VFK72933.1 MAG: hypothetical protein BECKUNK1418H_GA0071006_11506 [Candidatus Kentron sp. UNK]
MFFLESCTWRDDTRIAVGGEAMQEASRCVEAIAKISPGIESAAEQLGERFRPAKKKIPPLPNPAKPEPKIFVRYSPVTRQHGSSRRITETCPVGIRFAHPNLRGLTRPSGNQRVPIALFFVISSAARNLLHS